MNIKALFHAATLVALLVVVGGSPCYAQDNLPYDNGSSTYHTTPRYRESESHPLRIFSYVLHPIGWALREGVFRPLSYFASSTPEAREIMGFREPFDFRQPECFSADDSIPDCRSIMPFNYDQGAQGDVAAGDGVLGGDKQVYFPNVNFDFNSRKLNSLGMGKAKQIAQMLQSDPSVKVVLQGHTDFKGSESYNLKLGMDRAEALRKELLALGVSAERLSTVTFGESQPVFTEQEDWARAINRRVEAHPDSGVLPVAAVEEPTR